MKKRILTLAMALVMILALIPVTASASVTEKIENTFSDAIPISVGQKIELGGKQTAPTNQNDHIYYNIDSKFTFSLTQTTEVTFTLSTETPPSGYRDNWVKLTVLCADAKTDATMYDGSWIHSISVLSREMPLAKDYHVKLVPGTYFLRVEGYGANNAYGWLEYKSATPMQDDYNGEPNDTTAQAILKSSLSTGVEYKGNINYSGRENGGRYGVDGDDYYRFDVPNDGYGVKLTVSRADAGRGNNVTVSLLNSSGSRVGNAIDLNTSPSGEETFSNLNAGTYFIYFRSGMANSYETEYTFKLDSAAGSAPVTSTPPPVTPPTTTTSQPSATTLSASPTASTVYVNGAAKAFEAYNIGGNNYFKLRDLAYVLNGTVKQFEVGYDNATKAITLTSGKAYTSVGGEMAPGDGKAKTASPTASKIYLNGKELNLTVYLIGGNNFFKLRDLMEAIDVFVGYDNATKAITLDTSKGYEPEGSATTTTPETTTPPSTGDNATTMNALAGIWYHGATISNYYWSFGADGRFAYYISAKVLSNPYISTLTPYVSEFYYKGNYRVNGNVIEFFNCQVDSYFEYYSSTYKFFPDRDFSGNIFLDTPLQNPAREDDFTLSFEFINASRLRIIINRTDNSDNYDWLFDYEGTKGDVSIPTQNPTSAWPADKLPPDLPAYSEGRIISSNSTGQYYITIKIDGSTREYYIDYVERMVQSGWEWATLTKEKFEAFKRGEDFRNSSSFEKNGYRIAVIYSVNEIGLAEIIWWK